MRTDQYEPDVYAPDTKPLMQALLATLADIDFAHERDIERAVSTTAKNPSLKARVLHALTQKHRERRGLCAPDQRPKVQPCGGSLTPPTACARLFPSTPWLERPLEGASVRIGR